MMRSFLSCINAYFVSQQYQGLCQRMWAKIPYPVIIYLITSYFTTISIVSYLLISIFFALLLYMYFITIIIITTIIIHTKVFFTKCRLLIIKAALKRGEKPKEKLYMMHHESVVIIFTINLFTENKD